MESPPTSFCPSTRVVERMSMSDSYKKSIWFPRRNRQNTLFLLRQGNRSFQRIANTSIFNKLPSHISSTQDSLVNSGRARCNPASRRILCEICEPQMNLFPPSGLRCRNEVKPTSWPLAGPAKVVLAQDVGRTVVTCNEGAIQCALISG